MDGRYDVYVVLSTFQLVLWYVRHCQADWRDSGANFVAIHHII